MKRHTLRYHLLGSGVVAVFAATTLFAFAAPVHAQRMSLSERVSRLEQQVQNHQNSTVLINQIQDIKSQLRQQQGQIEELEHEVQQLKQSTKDQYVDLDSRLRQVEKGSQGGSGAPASAGSAPATGGSSAASKASPASAPAASASAPASSSSASQADAQSAQAAYNDAFQSLRSGDFVKASRAFRAFIQSYPSSSLTPNAYYWLGESYYVTQNYQVAQKTFQKLLSKFPNSAKAPGALLKIGYCQDAQHQTDAAEATFKKVVSTYPDNDVANLAKRRLKDIQLNQQSIN